MSETIIHDIHESIAQTEQHRAKSHSEDATSKTAMDPGCSTVSTTADALHDTTSSRDPSSSRLLTLPWEIRQKILQLALPYTDPDWFDNGEPLWYLGSTDVLRTCQQLHVEGTTVFYFLNPLYMVMSPGLFTEVDYVHIDPFFSFTGWKRCPKCLNEDDSSER